jgi:hypothetical protein
VPTTSSTNRRKAVKLQALAKFFADWEEAQQPEKRPHQQSWTLFFDGSKKIEGAGAEAILISPKGDKLHYALQITFTPCTNKEADALS